MDTDIAAIYFYKGVVVVEAHEGVTLSFTTGFTILLHGLRITGFSPFIYIANRVNSYSVSPTDYKYLNKINPLKGIAIVSDSESARNNAELEKNFCTKPLEIFENMEDAHEWAIGLLDEQNYFI
ncbi:MAG: hypothetical protein HKN48_07795 [Flavobacteriaceae bacterium]|nr:hypothetical protein [Flavobacteriaceae bacterium]